MKHAKTAAGSAKRQYRMTCLLGKSEKLIVDKYLEKYKIKNRSRWVREALLAHIYKMMRDADYPTLFDEHTMRR
ncbi:hypothetical protein EZS27_030703 [termite gut metagenome]|uniref:Ribbon-helix-helix protein CopG domain-containing protein n=1 Tax=termite gut metagenome TaxID=433724 RepID=A0A5J4QEE6_9ZZZZ